MKNKKQELEIKNCHKCGHNDWELVRINPEGYSNVPIPQCKNCGTQMKFIREFPGYLPNPCVPYFIRQYANFTAENVTDTATYISTNEYKKETLSKKIKKA